MATWRKRVPQRDLYIYRHEDVDVTLHFRSDGSPWTPPDDTETYFSITRGEREVLRLNFVTIDAQAHMHAEYDELANVHHGDTITLYVSPPGSVGGDTKVITEGTVYRA